MAKDKFIYHYCSVDTLMAIIQNKTLRLSDLNKTNDYMEKKWAKKLIVDILKEKLSEYEIKFDLGEDYWYDDKLHSHLAYYKNEVEGVVDDKSPILITCFSQEKDRLSQWRAYAEDGRGVAIGFNYEVLKRLNNRDKGFSVEKILYKKEKQQERLGQLIESVIYYMHDMFEKDSVRISDEFDVYFKDEFDVFCEVLVDYIGIEACVIKNPAFEEEKEIRIIYNPQLPNREILGDIQLEEMQTYFEKEKQIGSYKVKPLRFNYKNNQLVAFCDLDFSDLIIEPIITEIIIGPKSEVDERDIYYFLMANGFDANIIHISKSEATYR